MINKNDTIFRPLGDMEYTFWLMGFASRVNFVVMVRITGDFSDKVWREALNVVQSRHPLLNTRIIPDWRHGALFVPCDSTAISYESIELPETPPVGDIAYDTPLERRIAQEQQYDFNHATQPLLKCLLIRHASSRCTLTLTLNHTIADGRSGVKLAHELVTTAAALASNRTPALKQMVDEGPLECFIPVKHKGPRAFFEMMAHSLSMSLERLFPRLCHVPLDQHAWPDQRRDRYILTMFDETWTHRLIQTVKQHRCTVHSAICAAQLYALLAEYPKKDSIRAYVLSLVDLRHRMGQRRPIDGVNLMMSMVESCHRVSRRRDFWSLSRELQQTIRTLIGKCFHLRYFPQMSRIIHRTHFLRTNDCFGSKVLLRQGQLARPPVMPVSNIGQLDLPADLGDVHIDDISYVVPLTSSGYLGAAVSTFNGRLSWNFSYAFPSISKERALRQTTHSIDTLKSML